MSKKIEAAYIRVTKTGSTSIYNSISQEHCMTVAAKRRDIGKKLPLDSEFIFTFVRNPYDRIISSYEMLTRPGRSNFYRSGIGESMLGISFGEFLERIKYLRNRYDEYYLSRTGDAHILNLRIMRPSLKKDRQSRDVYKILHHTESMVSTIKVFCPVTRLDLIGKLEHMAADFQKIPKHLRIETQPPHLNTSKKRTPYQLYYDAQTIRTVSEMYEDDLAAFAYEFEAPETKPNPVDPHP